MRLEIVYGAGGSPPTRMKLKKTTLRIAHLRTTASRLRLQVPLDRWKIHLPLALYTTVTSGVPAISY